MKVQKPRRMFQNRAPDCSRLIGILTIQRVVFWDCVLSLRQPICLWSLWDADTKVPRLQLADLGLADFFSNCQWICNVFFCTTIGGSFLATKCKTQWRLTFSTLQSEYQSFWMEIRASPPWAQVFFGKLFRQEVQTPKLHCTSLERTSTFIGVCRKMVSGLDWPLPDPELIVWWRINVWQKGTVNKQWCCCTFEKVPLVAKAKFWRTHTFWPWSEQFWEVGNKTQSKDVNNALSQVKNPKVEGFTKPLWIKCQQVVLWQTQLTQQMSGNLTQRHWVQLTFSEMWRKFGMSSLQFAFIQNINWGHKRLFSLHFFFSNLSIAWKHVVLDWPPILSPSREFLATILCFCSAREMI